jgi:Zn-dependent protease
MEFLVFLIYIAVFLYSVILHEIAHGWTANYFGDDTARISGRLSFNPLAHIDPVGSILVPFLLYFSQSGFLFGWAKPVPVNPYRLRGGLFSYRWVAAAGVLTNFFLAVVSALVIKLTIQFFGLAANNLGVLFFTAALQINLVLAVFNFLPMPGFDGFNFLTTFKPVNQLLGKISFSKSVFLAQYGLVISIFFLFLLMPYISLLIGLIFKIFIQFFGI